MRRQSSGSAESGHVRPVLVSGPGYGHLYVSGLRCLTPIKSAAKTKQALPLFLRTC